MTSVRTLSYEEDLVSQIMEVIGKFFYDFYKKKFKRKFLNFKIKISKSLFFLKKFEFFFGGAFCFAS
jgi:hypothetical protein